MTGVVSGGALNCTHSPLLQLVYIRSCYTAVTQYSRLPHQTRTRLSQLLPKKPRRHCLADMCWPHLYHQLRELQPKFWQIISTQVLAQSYSWFEFFQNEAFNSICPLFERVLCIPASSAPVERIFSQRGMIIKANRARMAENLLEELVIVKCNSC